MRHLSALGRDGDQDKYMQMIRVTEWPEDLRKFLEKVRVVYICDRTERILTQNLKRAVPLRVTVGGDQQSLCRVECVFAVGDSLFSTDFRIGQGVNRGLSSVIQIVAGGKSPEAVRREVACLLPTEPPETLAKREEDAAKTRKWLLEGAREAGDNRQKRLLHEQLIKIVV